MSLPPFIPCAAGWDKGLGGGGIFPDYLVFQRFISSLVAVAGQGSWRAEAALLCDGDGSPSARSAYGRCGLGEGVGGGYFLPITCAIVNRTPPGSPSVPGEALNTRRGFFREVLQHIIDSIIFNNH